MTVNDLIKVLQTLPPNLTAVNEGYDGKIGANDKGLPEFLNHPAWQIII